MKFYQHESPETITTTLYLKLNMNTSEGLFFFHPQLLAGIISIITFKIWNWLVLLKNKCSKLSDKVLIIHSMYTNLKLLTRLQVGLNQLCKHKFKYNFQDSLGPYFISGGHIETTIHLFLHCSNDSNERKIF